MKGLSSGALQNTTSFAQPSPSRSAVASAAALMMAPIRLTASMLMPFFVVPRLIDEHTRPVSASARGIDSMSRRSPEVMPFCTSAENPPTKSTSSSLATSSRVFAHGVKSVSSLGSATSEMGVTAMRLLMIGTPNSASISRPTLTSRPAVRRSLSRMRRRDSSPEGLAQSLSEMPMVIARTSSLWRMNISTVSCISRGEKSIVVSSWVCPAGVRCGAWRKKPAHASC